MADPLFPDRSEVEKPFDPTDFIIQQRAHAQVRAAFPTHTPEEASRAIQLGQSTGTPSSIIGTDVEGYDAQTRRGLTDGIVSENQYLADYVRRHPLSASLSQNDWGDLDELSNQIRSLHIERIPFLRHFYNLARAEHRALGVGLTAAQEAFGNEPLASHYDPPEKWTEPFDPQGFTGKYITPVARSIDKDLSEIEWMGGDIIRTAMRGMAGATMGSAAFFGEIGRELGIKAAPEITHAMAEASMDQGFWASIAPTLGPAAPFAEVLATVMRAAQERFGNIKAMGPEVQQSLRIADKLKETRLELEKERAAKEPNADKIAILGERMEQGEKAFKGRLTQKQLDFMEEFLKQREKIDKVAEDVGEAQKAGDPWIRNNIDPPYGQHDLIDELHEDRVKDDIDKLDEVVKTIQKIPSFVENPEFMREHFLDGSHGEWMKRTVHISQDGVEKLYPGEDLPEPGDGKLGDISGMRDKVANAKVSGELQLTRSELATLDKEAYKEIHDFIRTRPHGPTLDEVHKSSIEDQFFQKDPRFKDITPASARPAAEVRAERQAEIIKRRGKLIEDDPLMQIPFDPKDDLGLLGHAAAKLVFPLRDLIDKLDVEHMSGYSKMIHDFFADRARREVGDVDVIVVPGNDLGAIGSWGAAAYYSQYHQIAIPENMLLGKGDWTTGRVAHVAMEEATHAATSHALNRNPEIKAQTELLRSYTLAKMSEEHKSLYSYALQNNDEFISWARSHEGFRAVLQTIPVDHTIRARLSLAQNVKTVWEAARLLVKNLFEKFLGREMPTSVMDAIFRISERIEEYNAEVKMIEGMLKERGDVFGEIRHAAGANVFFSPKIEEGEPTPAAMGITKRMNKQYLEKMRAENERLANDRFKLGLEDERARQTKEWKEAEAKVREEVDQDLIARPDIAVDKFLREGMLYGEKVRRRRLNADDLTAEQKRKLSPEHYSDRGLDPQAVAQRFGYQSADSMIEFLAKLENERRMEGLTPAAHYNRLREIETERLMRARYGDLQENILESAKDHVTSPEVIDRLAEQYQLLGMKAHGEGFNITKEQVQGWAKKEFNGWKMGGISSDKLLADAGRAGKELQKAQLDDRWTDAFKHTQTQFIRTFQAGLARKAEKARKQFEENVVPGLLKREHPTINPAYLNWIHDILSRTGYSFGRGGVRRTPEDLAREIGAQDHQTLREFVVAKNFNKALWSEDVGSMPSGAEMPVADFLLDPKYVRHIDDMTWQEFQNYSNSVKAIAHTGRDVDKVLAWGQKMDLGYVVERLVQQMRLALDQNIQTGQGGAEKIDALKMIAAMVVRPETFFNRLDLDNPRGAYNQVIIRRAFDMENETAKMLKDYDKKFRSIWDYLPIRKAIDNRLFKDPATGNPITMTHENMIAVLSNIGNALQHMKLARGYGVTHGQSLFDARNDYGYRVEYHDPIMDWLFQNTTKQDWDRAQALGDLFNELFEHSATMYRRINGVAPERIELTPIETPFGTYRGWYHPLVPHPQLSTAMKGLIKENLLDESGYYRPAPASGYTKGRTGAVYPILLDFSAIPSKIFTMINDIGMREGVGDLAKIFYHPRFEQEFKRNFGKEYYSELIPWLRDIAGKQALQTVSQNGLLKIAEFARENIINQLIGLNPGTVAKHFFTAAILSMREVGPVNYLGAVRDFWLHDPETGERWSKFAHENSLELQRRMRNWQETLTGSQLRFFQPQTPYWQARSTMQWIGALPVAMSDYVSAGPMWLAAYRKAIRDGMPHGEAVFEGDRAVRRAHGTTAMAGRPKIMRLGTLGHYLVPFYNFFNTVLNLKYEMAWKAKMMLENRARMGDPIESIDDGIITLRPSQYTRMDDRKLEFKAGADKIPHIAGYFFATTIAVAAIEQLVEHALRGQMAFAPQKKDETWGGNIARGLVYGEASVWPVGRDIANSILRGEHNTAGVYTNTFGTIEEFVKDLSKGRQMMDKNHAVKTIRDFNSVFALMSGLSNNQIGDVGAWLFEKAEGRKTPEYLLPMVRKRGGR